MQGRASKGGPVLDGGGIPEDSTRHGGRAEGPGPRPARVTVPGPGDSATAAAAGGDPLHDTGGHSQ